MNKFIYNQITDILEENNIHISDFLNYAIQKEENTIIKELEEYLQLRNGYHKARPQDKEEKAFLEGVISALHIITRYAYTFDKQQNKIIKIEEI